MNRTVKVKALGKFVALALAMGFACAVPAYAEEGVAPTSTDDWNFAFSLHVYGDTDGTEWRERRTLIPQRTLIQLISREIPAGSMLTAHTTLTVRREIKAA